MTLDNSELQIRAYTPEDKKNIIEIFRTNVPDFFAETEEADLSEYLDNRIEKYFTVFSVKVHKIIACGGINYLPETKTARLSWDFADRQFHGKGAGGLLLRKRTDDLLADSDIDNIEVRTSQLAFNFYLKFGFELIEMRKNFWAENFDLYHLRLNKAKYKTMFQAELTNSGIN